MDENHPLQGQSPYSASKISADKIVESYFRSFGTPVTTIRPFNTFGPRQSARAIIPTIISQALVSDVVTIGDQSPVRDLTYVKDMVRAFVLMAENHNTIGKTIHFGTGRGVKVGELASIIFKLLNKNVEIKTDPSRVRPTNSEVFELICDYALAKEITGWDPTHSLEDGLIKTIDFIKHHLHLFKTTNYSV